MRNIYLHTIHCIRKCTYSTVLYSICIPVPYINLRKKLVKKENLFNRKDMGLYVLCLSSEGLLSYSLHADRGILKVLYVRPD
jgi:hypothetical protein